MDLEKLKRNATVHLQKRLGTNQAMMTVPVLKDDLKDFWRFQPDGSACHAGEGWQECPHIKRIAP